MVACLGDLDDWAQSRALPGMSNGISPPFVGPTVQRSDQLRDTCHLLSCLVSFIRSGTQTLKLCVF
jgi:hypothetical protein